jgi:hypothetical protein
MSLEEYNYSDSNWKTGIAPLGYGNTSVATIIGYGGVATNKYTTAYFRKTFQLSQLSSKTDLYVSFLISYFNIY